MKKERILASVRLSLLRDASQTGVDKQREKLIDYARTLRVEEADILWAEDSNVKGSKSPFERPGLGPWLTDPELIAQYDVIIANKVDRLGRNARDLQELRYWATDHGKRIVVTSLNLEWPAKPGIEGIPAAMMWELLGQLAEAELESISDRVSDTYHHLRTNGKWMGGRITYGYQHVCACHGLPPKSPECPDPRGYVMAIHDEHAAIVREIALRVIGKHPDHTDTPNGESVRHIAVDLNRRGVPSPQGRKWGDSATKRVLVNPAVLGYATYHPIVEGRKGRDGRPVRTFDSEIMTDPNTGMGVRHNPPIIEQELYDLVGEKLASTARPGRASMNAYLLTAIIECPCGLKMYHKKGRNDLEYYKHDPQPQTAHISDHCTHKAIRMEVADSFINQWIEDNYSKPIMEQRLIGGGEKARKIAEIKTQRAKHMDDWNAGRITEDQFDAYKAKLSERLAELEKSADDAPVFEYVPTNKTLAGEWANWPVSQRNKWLRDSNIRVIASDGRLAVVSQ